MLEKIGYKDVWKFTWHYWRRDKYKLSIAVAGLSCSALIDAVIPVITGMLIDAIHRFDFETQDIWERVWPIFLTGTALGVAYQTTRNGAMFFWNKFAVQRLFEIENEAFQKVQGFSSDWHANSFAGSTVRKITRAKWAFDVYGDILFMNVLPSIVVMMSILTYTSLKSPWLGLATLVSGSLYLWLNVFMVTKINAPKFRVSAARDTAIGAQMADTITANAVVKAFGSEQREKKRFQHVMRRWRLRTLHGWNSYVTTDLIRRYMSEIMAFAMIGTAILLWSHGKATPGDVVFALTSCMFLSMYLRALGDNMANLQRAITDMEDAIVFWLREDELQDDEDAKELVVSDGAIAFDDVRFTYKGKNEPLFDGLNVSIQPGEKVALVGHSGSGKTSFVKILQRLYDVEGGAVRIDGQNIAEVTQESLRRNIALVPQDPVLFHRSLAANIAYGKPNAPMDEIIAAAKQAYAHEFIDALPQGYDTLVGERGIKLSGGERQRVAIARAILADTKILILDEATSALDSVSEHYIQKALENLVQGKTTITIAHRLSTVQDADRILVFEDGRIMEEGSHEQLIRSEGSVYRELYEMQAFDLVGE